MTDTPKKRLERAKRLYLSKLRDGCNDCRDVPHGGYCNEHLKEAQDMALNPRECAELQLLLVQMRLEQL